MEQSYYCPRQGCGQLLQKHNERGVIIDVCPVDGLMVLERGELSAIIAQLAAQPGFNPHRAGQPAHVAPPVHHTRHHGDSSDHRRSSHHRNSSGGIFGGLFD